MAGYTLVTGVKVNGSAEGLTKAVKVTLTKASCCLIKNTGLVLTPIQTDQSSKEVS
jgi:hypothetical protein